MSRGKAPSYALEQIAQCGAHLHLGQAGAREMSGETEAFGALALAERCPPVGPASDDERYREERLDIVDDGRPAEEARFRRKGWLRTGHGASALERLHERRLLPEHKAACAPAYLDLHRELTVEHAMADKAPAPRVLQRLRHALGREMRLAVDIEVHAARAGRIGREQGAFEQPVGITFHEVTVLENARLAFLAIDDEIF